MKALDSSCSIGSESTHFLSSSLILLPVLNTSRKFLLVSALNTLSTLPTNNLSFWMTNSWRTCRLIYPILELTIVRNLSHSLIFRPEQNGGSLGSAQMRMCMSPCVFYVIDFEPVLYWLFPNSAEAFDMERYSVGGMARPNLQRIFRKFAKAKRADDTFRRRPC